VTTLNAEQQVAVLADRLQRLRRQTDRMTGEARQVALRGQSVQADIGTLTAEIALYEKVTGVLSSIGEQRQVAAQHTIEGLVSRGLQTVFEAPELSFHITQSLRGKQVVVDFIVRTTFADGHTVDTDVLAARGGGMAAVVGFLLRLVLLLLAPSRQSSLLILDEPFAHLSREYVPAMASFLRELCDKTSVQIVLVTHQPEFAEVADVRHQFSLDEHGHTQTREQ
jgi:DNA repair exonuclease SbcCD ATPase subunit